MLKGPKKTYTLTRNGFESRTPPAPSLQTTVTAPSSSTSTGRLPLYYPLRLVGRQVRLHAQLWPTTRSQLPRVQ